MPAAVVEASEPASEAEAGPIESVLDRRHRSDRGQDHRVRAVRCTKPSCVHYLLRDVQVQLLPRAIFHSDSGSSSRYNAQIGS